MSADGSPIEVLGKLLLPIWFGTCKLYVTVFVIQGTTHTALLGLDVLQKFSVWSVDIKHAQLKLDSIELPLQVVANNLPTVCRVSLQADVVIPPEGFAWVNAKLPERYLPSEAVFHPEPHLSTRKKVLAANGLVQNNVLSNAVKVKIMNPEDKPRKLYHGTKLGTLVSSPWKDYELVTDPFGEQQQSQGDAGVRICHASDTQAASTEEEAHLPGVENSFPRGSRSLVARYTALVKHRKTTVVSIDTKLQRCVFYA